MFLLCVAPTAPPVNLNAGIIDSTTIVLSWSPPPAEDRNGIIRHYIVNITELDTGETFQLTSMATEITLHSLHPFYTYVCVVTAVTVGPGPVSHSFSVQTPQDG